MRTSGDCRTCPPLSYPQRPAVSTSADTSGNVTSPGQVFDEKIVARHLVLEAFEAHIELFRFDEQANESLPHELLNPGHKE